MPFPKYSVGKSRVSRRSRGRQKARRVAATRGLPSQARPTRTVKTKVKAWYL